MASANLHQITGTSFFHPWGISIVTVESSSFESQWPLCILPPLCVSHPVNKQIPVKTWEICWGSWGGKISHWGLKPEILAVPRATLAVSICITAATKACILLLLLWVEDFCRYNRWPECFHVQPRSERAVCHSPVRHLLIRQGHCYKWLFFTFGFLQLSFPFRLTHTFTCVVTCEFSLSPCPDCWPVWFFN